MEGKGDEPMFKDALNKGPRCISCRRLFGPWVLSLALLLGLAACTSKSQDSQAETAVASGAARAASNTESKPEAIAQVVSLEQFKSDVLSKSGKTVVDFYATWCGPCKLYSPILEKMAEEKLQDVSFRKVDVDKAKDIAREYSIEAMPTTIIFENGKEVQRFLGVQDEASIKQALGL
jgi:thioredoxin 1